MATNGVRTAMNRKQHNLDAAGNNDADQDTPEPKRKKLRKGTQSCWECKRRKARCTFPENEAGVCDGCRRRGSKCISQDLPDESSTGTREDLYARLGRVETRTDEIEDLLAQFIKGSPASIEKLISKLDNRDQKQQSDRHAKDPILSEGVSAGPHHKSRATRQQPSLAGRHSDTILGLKAAWPNQLERAAILAIRHTSELAYRVIEKTLGTHNQTYDTTTLSSLLDVPPAGSHPVLYAHKLLTLGIVLQSVVVQPANRQGPSHETFASVMSRVVMSSIILITADDELLDSVESIECLMLASSYHNNAGQLKSAFMTNRRAVTVAQVMGLHRTRKATSLKTLYPQTRSNLRPEQMWLRLVQSDQYLSMMLGIPGGVASVRLPTPEALRKLEPLENLELLHSAAAQRILLRAETADRIHSGVEDIDRLIKDAAACMPATWWLNVNPAAISGAGEQSITETARLMKHLTHYHLLIQLHLPALVRLSDDPLDFYSKNAAITASRELLTRFLAYRKASPDNFCYCRGVDLLAFIASTVLCLAHIQLHSLENDGTDRQSTTILLGFLGHQRYSDRGLVESTLAIIQDLADTETDTISSNIAAILQPLLEIESEAAAGIAQYATSATIEGDEDTSVDAAGIDQDPHILTLRIPNSGTIGISRYGISLHGPSEGEALHLPQADPDSNVDSQAGPDAGLEPAVNLLNKLSAAKEQYLDDAADGASPLESNNDYTDDETHQLPALTPTLDAAAENTNFTLEGVDIALFDSIFNGAYFESSGPEDDTGI